MAGCGLYLIYLLYVITGSLALNTHTLDKLGEGMFLKTIFESIKQCQWEVLYGSPSRPSGVSTGLLIKANTELHGTNRGVNVTPENISLLWHSQIPPLNNRQFPQNRNPSEERWMLGKPPDTQRLFIWVELLICVWREEWACAFDFPFRA